MRHNLRTPVNAVLGFAQLLEVDHLSDDQHESVQQIARGGRHLLQLIDEVLDVARLEIGEKTIALVAPPA
jgi:signal transduction histidine kinase